jgi:cytochrome d ubiquinol oxidase subunit II
VPLDSSGFFFLPLFTNFRPGVHPGVFDWYTTLVGIFALCTIAGHGALYLVWKTEGAVQSRSALWARSTWLTVPPLWALTTLATAWIQPEIFRNLAARPWSLILVVLMVGGLWGVFHFRSRARELAAFLSSSAFILGILASTMTGLYPIWMRSTIDAEYSLTVANSAAASYGLRAALYWWTIGITLAGLYFAYVFRSTRGKVGIEPDVHEY